MPEFKKCGLHRLLHEPVPVELLYFSLITLSTVGYGDIVPITGTARILTALEGVTGVLYIAITVALLVSRFRGEPWDYAKTDRQ